MSKLARVLAIGAMVAAMTLAGVTAVAQASNDPAGNQDARRPPAERQVGEAWRHGQIAADQPPTTRTPGGRPPRPKWGSLGVTR